MHKQEMDLKLYPYQKKGRDFLISHRQAYLADEMGLGKTIQTITAAEMLYPMGQQPRILIICPAIARHTWANEWLKWGKRNYLKKIITTKSHVARPSSPYQILISSFDLVDPKAKAFQNLFDLLIIDEAHFLKNPTAKRTKNILGKNGIAHRAKRIWCLSGTPAPNHPGELWTMLYTFGRTTLKYESFIKKYCNTYLSTYGNHSQLTVTGAKTKMFPELQKLIKPILLRRKKDEVGIQLPPLMFSDITVPASDVAIDEYPHLVKWVYPHNRMDEFKQTISNEERMVKEILNKTETTSYSRKAGWKALELLAPSISTLRMYTGLQKTPAAIKLIQSELEAKAYNKIVIFAVHQVVIETVRRALKDFNPVTIYGKTPAERKQINLRRFQTDPRCRVFIGNIQAAGTNITLTSAADIIFLEQSWVPGDNAQAAMRCHRIGQKKAVHVRVVALENSLDQKIATVLTRKTKELSQLFNKKRYEVFSVDEEGGAKDTASRTDNETFNPLAEECQDGYVDEFTPYEGDIFS